MARLYAIDHRKQSAVIHRVAFLNYHIQYHSVFACGEIELVSSLGVAPVFDDDVGVWLKHTDHLISSRYALSLNNTPHGLVDDAQGEFCIVLSWAKVCHLIVLLARYITYDNFRCIF